MTPVSIATAYYTAMNKKNVIELEEYLHPQVQFNSPFKSLKGKAATIQAIKELIPLFKTLTIRATFGSEDQAVVVYDLDFPAPIGNCPTTALLSFKKKQIAAIELFFDTRRFS